MSQTQALSLQLGVFARPDADRAEVVDQVAGSLELRGAGARSTSGGRDGIRRSAPGLNGGGGGASSSDALLATERVDHLALPVAAQHPMTRALRGDVDAEVTELPEHGLR